MENKSTTGKKAMMIAASMLIAAVAGVAAAPTASAHWCSSFWGSDCGSCASGTHQHYGLFGCQSVEGAELAAASSAIELSQ